MNHISGTYIFGIGNCMQESCFSVFIWNPHSHHATMLCIQMEIQHI